MNLEYVYLPQNVSNKNVCFGRRSRDRKPNFAACSAGIVGGWVVARGTKSYLGLAGNIYLIYLAWRT